MTTPAISNDCRELPARAPTTDGNPEGKGVNGLLADWRATEPRGVVAKPQRQVLAELFTSMLVLSASFKYRPVPGGLNYLYWIDETWSLSLIAPHEWSEEKRASYIAKCVLQRDMTWTIVPSELLVDEEPQSDRQQKRYKGRSHEDDLRAMKGRK